MRVEWSVDEETVAAVWGTISELTPSMVPVRAGDRILDLGGGNGDFASSLSRWAEDLRVVSMDVDRQALGGVLPGVEPVLGDALALPFCDDSLSVITARAVLHHIPGELHDAMAESRRALRPSRRIVVQEPCSGNAFANLARSLFSTERHEEGEEALDPDELLAAVGAAFRILEVRRHFVLSYLMPHVVARSPRGLRRLLRGVALALARLDEELLRGSGFMRRRCAYITVVAENARPDRRDNR